MNGLRPKYDKMNGALVVFDIIANYSETREKNILQLLKEIGCPEIVERINQVGDINVYSEYGNFLDAFALENDEIYNALLRDKQQSEERTLFIKTCDSMILPIGTYNCKTKEISLIENQQLEFDVRRDTQTFDVVSEQSENGEYIINVEGVDDYEWKYIISQKDIDEKIKNEDHLIFVEIED